MIDATDAEKTFSYDDEDDVYEAFEFDPEQTFVDDDSDTDTLAFRDAVRDIWACEGHFELIVP